MKGLFGSSTIRVGLWISLGHHVLRGIAVERGVFAPPGAGG